MSYIRSIIPPFEFLKTAFLDLQLGIFLCLCLILGGTSQDIIQPKYVLYIFSILIIAVNMVRFPPQSNWKVFLIPISGLGIIILTCLLQLVPLPPDIWSNIQGRDSVAQAFDTLGIARPWLPISLTPEITRFSLLDFLPPIAIITIFANGITQESLIKSVKFILAISIISIFLGLLQFSTSQDIFYLYEVTNDKSLVGFFSNRNHLVTLLLVAFPFAVSLLYQRSDTQKRSLLLALPLAIIFGIILVGSLFGYVLALPVILLSLFIYATQKRINFVPLYIFIILGFAITAIDTLLLNGYILGLIKTVATLAFDQRVEFTFLTYEVARDYFPMGSGLGSFENVYKQYSHVGTRFVNHAHNDFIEILLEFGVFGVIYLIAFILYLVRMTLNVADSNLDVSIFAWPAVIGIGVITLHSFVDYPLRTIAISSLFTFCLCLLHHSLDKSADPSTAPLST